MISESKIRSAISDAILNGFKDVVLIDFLKCIYITDHICCCFHFNIA